METEQFFKPSQLFSFGRGINNGSDAEFHPIRFTPHLGVPLSQRLLQLRNPPARRRPALPGPASTQSASLVASHAQNHLQSPNSSPSRIVMVKAPDRKPTPMKTFLRLRLRYLFLSVVPSS